jgi:hypothetical protein
VVEYLWVFDHVGFFLFCGTAGRPSGIGTIAMLKTSSTMAQQIAQATIAFEQRRTGHVPDRRQWS